MRIRSRLEISGRHRRRSLFITRVTFYATTPRSPARFFFFFFLFPPRSCALYRAVDVITGQPGKIIRRSAHLCAECAEIFARKRARPSRREVSRGKCESIKRRKQRREFYELCNIELREARWWYLKQYENQRVGSIL